MPAPPGRRTVLEDRGDPKSSASQTWRKTGGYPLDGLQLTLVTGGLPHIYIERDYLYIYSIQYISIHYLFIIYLLSIYLYYRPTSCQTSGMILRGKTWCFFAGKWSVNILSRETFVILVHWDMFQKKWKKNHWDMFQKKWKKNPMKRRWWCSFNCQIDGSSHTVSCAKGSHVTAPRHGTVLGKYWSIKSHSHVGYSSVPYMAIMICINNI